MARLNLILLLALVAVALFVVNSNHQARRLFTAMEREQKHTRALEDEWGQLQLEQSTWAAHVRIEKIAHEKLGMKPPAQKQVLVLQGTQSAAAPAGTPGQKP